MRRPVLTYANVMSSVAVVLAMSGTAVAATQISGSTIKDRTIGHKKLVLNTVTGAEVKESSLARVPSATSATNAGKLDGIDSTGFVRGSGVKVSHTHRAGLPDDNNTNVTLLTIAGVGRLALTCYGDHAAMSFTDTTSAKEVLADYSGDNATNFSTVYNGALLDPNNVMTNPFVYAHDNSGVADSVFRDDITVVVRNAAQTTVKIQLVGATDVGGGNTCDVFADATLY